MTIASLDTCPPLFPHRRPHQRNDPKKNGCPSVEGDLSRSPAHKATQVALTAWRCCSLCAPLCGQSVTFKPHLWTEPVRPPRASGSEYPDCATCAAAEDVRAIEAHALKLSAATTDFIMLTSLADVSRCDGRTPHLLNANSAQLRSLWG